MTAPRSPASVEGSINFPGGRPGSSDRVFFQDPASETHRLLAAIVEDSNDAIFSRTLSGIITTWNAAAERIFGYRAEEIIGRSSQALMPRGREDELRQLVAGLRRGQMVQHFETERIRKNGQCLSVSLTLSPIRDAAEKLIGFSTIARDISDQRRMRRELERHERELDDLFEGASVGLLLTTPEGRILRANPSLLALVGRKLDEGAGETLFKFHPDRTALLTLLKRLAGRETLRNFQMMLRTHSGQIKEVLVDANALWEDDKIVHIRWIIRDISRRKQLEREILAISERERRAFSRELHDSVGQHLTGITYLCNVVRDRLLEQGSPEAVEVARIAKLLKQAIEETRRVSRGLSPVRPEPEGLSTALRELAAHTRDVFGIVCRFHCRKPLLVTDSEAATHLYRIAQEAVNNAIRHGRARSVTIGLNQRRGTVILSVSDNGQGIQALSPTRKGLGLRVMQYRTGLLRGTLSVTRRPEGGTWVQCLVPASSLLAAKSSP